MARKKSHISYRSRSGETLLLIGLPDDVHKVNFWTKSKQLGYRSRYLVFGEKKIPLDKEKDYEYIGLYRKTEESFISERADKEMICEELNHTLLFFKEKVYAVLKINE